MRLALTYIILFISTQLFAQEHVEQLYKLRNLGTNINTSYIEGEPKISPDGKTLFFTRRNDRRNIGGKNDDGDIWFSKMLADSSWSEAKNLGKPVNNYSFNQVIAIQSGGKIMLVSGAYQAQYNSDIYITAKSQLGWTTPKIIPFENLKFKNNDATYTATPDLKILIFSMKNFSSGFGKNDLYVSFLDSLGKWSTPINLGNSVNTSEDELYPVIAHDKKTLYFSSKGHDSYGDFDIFVTKRLDETWQNWSQAKNLGKNINTIGYDADFTFDAKNKFAFISSDMEAVEDFDIYQLEMPAKNKPMPVANVNIEIHNLINKPNIIYNLKCTELVSKEVITKEDSLINNYKLLLPVGQDYLIEISSKDFTQSTDTIKLSDAKSFKNIQKRITIFPQKISFTFDSVEVESLVDNQNIDIQNIDSLISKTNLKIKHKSNKNNIIPIHALKTKQSFTLIVNNLTFESGKTELSSKETSMLDELAMELNYNKNLFVEITGHTDNTGSSNTNLKLSLQRAKQVANYLINQGLDEKRISVKGLGETQPVAPNTTEELRKFNRRVEFKIYLKNH